MDGENYDIWHRKIQYLLNEQNVITTIDQTLIAHKERNTAQHRRDQEVYKNWLDKDRCARFTMLSSMYNDLIDEFEQYSSAKDLWEATKHHFDITSFAKVQGPTMKFDSYQNKTNIITL